MDLVGEDEMKDRAGRNQPRERSQSMKNRKKKNRADEIEARGRAGGDRGALGSAARRTRREDSAGFEISH